MNNKNNIPENIINSNAPVYDQIVPEEPDRSELEQIEKELEKDGFTLEDELIALRADLEDSTGEEGIIRDPYRQYLKEIHKMPLLTNEETAELAGRIKNGDEDAKKKLVASNLGLVIGFAKKYMNGRYDLLLDLIQEGNKGLIKAAERFDPSTGFRFSTYAYWWIKNEIMKASASQDRTIKVPGTIIQSINKLQKIVNRFTAETGRSPQDTEIAKEMGIPVDKVKELLLYSYTHASLNAAVGEDGESEFYEMIPDDSESQSDKADRADFLRRLCVIMSDVLTDIQVRVLILRRGLPLSVKENVKDQRFIVEIKYDDTGDPQYSEPMTIENVGKTLGLSAYQVKSKESKAIAKMKIALSERGFKEYL